MSLDYWNLLCKIVERNNLSEIKVFLDQAKLFVFDKPPHEFLPQGYCQDIADVLDDLHLPFPITAIQDSAGLMIFIDTEKDQIGLSKKRLIVELLSSNAAEECFDARLPGVNNLFPHQYPDTHQISLSEIKDVVWNSQGIAGAASLSKVFAVQGVDVLACVTGQEVADRVSDAEYMCQNNILTGIQELAYLLQPKHFIFETTPKRLRQPKNNKIPRSHERAIYTLCTPGVIRKTMGLDHPGNGSSKAPHERSGHYRTLKADRYKENRGKRIWVKPTWIGPSEVINGTKKYKVRLDL